jgi:hypothetical protein
MELLSALRDDNKRIISIIQSAQKTKDEEIPQFYSKSEQVRKQQAKINATIQNGGLSR